MYCRTGSDSLCPSPNFSHRRSTTRPHVKDAVRLLASGSAQAPARVPKFEVAVNSSPRPPLEGGLAWVGSDCCIMQWFVSGMVARNQIVPSA
jgi:hypothetical protein